MSQHCFARERIIYVLWFYSGNVKITNAREKFIENRLVLVLANCEFYEINYKI